MVISSQSNLKIKQNLTNVSSAPAATTKTTGACSFTGSHPNVLLVQWEIHARKGQWLFACEIAEALVVALPAEPIGWIYHAFALQKIGRVLEARLHLLAAARRFPTDWRRRAGAAGLRSEEHTSELQSHSDLVCRLLLEKKKKKPEPRLRRTHAETLIGQETVSVKWQHSVSHSSPMEKASKHPNYTH